MPGAVAHGAQDGIAGQVFKTQLLRREADFSTFLLRGRRRDIDAGVIGHAEFGGQIAEELAGIAAGLRDNLGGKQAEDDAVLVGGPHRRRRV